jgi:hypothetical protein
MTKMMNQKIDAESDRGDESIRFLLSGIDTLQCCYYLVHSGESEMDFEALWIIRERLRGQKGNDPEPVRLGSMDFLLAPSGSQSGYPLVLSNSDFRIECGENNVPSFYVTFRSEALWREGAKALHFRFLKWATELGFRAQKSETLSRVDFTFDYTAAVLDFGEKNFVSLASKDATHREHGKDQTFQFGKDDVVLRVYDKIAEIKQKSSKTWFYKLWGQDSDVWRIEWQTRKDALRRFGIRTFDDLNDQQGDILRYLATEHTTLRIKGKDSNRSRWALHPLWIDLQEQISTFDATGMYREVDEMGVLNERLMRIAISMYGNLKRVAAIRCMQNGDDFMPHGQALLYLTTLLNKVHNPLDWRQDVEKRIQHMRLGQW